MLGYKKLGRKAGRHLSSLCPRTPPGHFYLTVLYQQFRAKFRATGVVNCDPARTSAF